MAVIGESGSGKSTLLKCIYGLLSPDQGEVLFEGKRVKGPEEQLIPGHAKMKMVTQDFALNLYAKVYDNVASMLSNQDIQGKREKTLAMLETLRIIALKDKKVIHLSGGEQQRVAIARALVGGTEVLLLDEPFSQVDSMLKAQLRRDLKKLAREKGITLLLVSHDPADALSMADQVLILKEGKRIDSGTPRKVYEQPAATYTATLLAQANVLNATAARTLEIAVAENERIVIYPEWIGLEINPERGQWQVIEVDYKGSSEDLLIQHVNGLTLKATTFVVGSYKKNDLVQLNTGRYLTF